jgi:hypothetical protein
VQLSSVGHFNEVGLVSAEIRVDPDPDFAVLADEDHLLDDVEVAHFFVEDFEAFEGGLDEVELIGEGDVVDFFEAEVNLSNVEEALVEGGAEIDHGDVDEVLDGVDVGGQFEVALVAGLTLEAAAGGFLPDAKILDVLHIVAFGEELDVVLLDLFAGLLVAKGAVVVAGVAALKAVWLGNGAE